MNSESFQIWIDSSLNIRVFEEKGKGKEDLALNQRFAP